MVPRNKIRYHKNPLGTRWGRIFTCAQCGEQWAKLEGTSDSAGYVLSTWRCRLCGPLPGDSLAGSVLPSLISSTGISLTKILAQADESFLLSELMLLLEQYEPL